MQPAYSVEFAPKSVWVIDRRGEAAAIVARIAGSHGRYLFLHGPDEAGKTALLSWWVMPTLAIHFPVYYGACTTELPTHVEAISDQRKVPLKETLAADGIVFLDDFDCFFSQSTVSQRQDLVNLLRGDVRAKTVFISSDEHLGGLLSLRHELPELFENRIEIDALLLEESISRLTPPDGLKRCHPSPEFIQALEEDLASLHLAGNNLSPCVLTVLAAEIHERLYLTPGGTLEYSHYQQAGGIRSLLDSYASKILNAVPEAVATPRVARMVLERFGCGTEGNVEDLAALAARIESEPDTCKKALAWLKEESGLLKSSCDGNQQLIPPPLRTVLDEQVGLRRRAAKPALQIVQNGVRSWDELGTLLPASRFEEVHRYRIDLVLTKEQTIFLAESALCCARSGDTTPVQYWLGRVADPDEELGILLRALASKDAEVRRNAIALLSGRGDAEIQAELYRAALEDTDAVVRSEARSALSRLDSVDAIWNPVAQEARDPGSPYRIPAIQALSVFRTPASAELLSQLVLQSESNEEVRVAAAQSLSAIGTPEAVRALVKIALRDDDESDRQRAAAELAKLNSSELAGCALEYLRAEEDKAHAILPKLRLLKTPAILLRYVAAAFTGLVALVFPPILSFSLRWYATGAVLTIAWLTGFLGLWLIKNNAAFLTVLVAMIGVSFIAHILPAGFLMRRRAKEQISARSFEGALGEYLFILVSFGSFFTVHGILHFLVQTWRKGRLLLGLQILGMLCIAFFFVARGTYNMIIVSWVAWLYLAVGIALWLTTWTSDAFGVGERLLRPAAVLVRERQNKLWRVLLGNNFVAKAALSAAESSDNKERLWSRALVYRFVTNVPESLWIEQIRTRRSAAPAWCFYGLRQAKFPGGRRDLEDLWSNADNRLKSRLVSILASNPSDVSAQCSKTFFRELGWLDRMKYSFARFRLRLQVMPTSVWLCAFLLLPIIVGLALEAVYVAQDSSRLLVRIIASPQAISKQPSLVTATAAYLLQAHPKRMKSALAALREIVRRPGQERLEAIEVLTLRAVEFEHPEVAEQSRTLLAEILPDITRMLAQESASSSSPAVRMQTQRQLIAALRAVNDDNAAIALREVVLKSSKPVSGDRVGSAPLGAIDEPVNRDLCSEAIRALAGMPLASAGEALHMIRNKAGTVGVRKEADAEYKRMTTRLVDALKTDLGDGSLQKVIADGGRIQRLLGETDHRNAGRLSAFLVQAKARLAESASDTNEALRLGNEAVNKLNGLPKSGWTELTNEDASRIYFRQAERLNSATKYPEALTTISRAIPLAPSAPEIRATRAIILFNSGSLQEAIAELATVQTLRPDYAFSYRLKGEMEMRSLKYEAALTQLKKAADLDPKDNTTYSLIGETYHRRSQDRLGVKVLQEFFQRYGSQGALLSQMFIYHENLSESDPSAFQENYRLHTELFDRFGATLANDDSVLASFAEAAYTSGRHDEAIRRAQPLIAKRSLPPHVGLPVNIILCAAYLSRNERSRAASRIPEIRLLLTSGKIASDDWSYHGLSNYLKNSGLNQSLRTKLTELLTQISTDPQKVTPEMLEAIHQELMKKS